MPSSSPNIIGVTPVCRLAAANTVSNIHAGKFGTQTVSNFVRTSPHFTAKNLLKPWEAGRTPHLLPTVPRSPSSEGHFSCKFLLKKNATLPERRYRELPARQHLPQHKRQNPAE